MFGCSPRSGSASSQCSDCSPLCCYVLIFKNCPKAARKQGAQAQLKTPQSANGNSRKPIAVITLQLPRECYHKKAVIFIYIGSLFSNRFSGNSQRSNGNNFTRNCCTFNAFRFGCLGSGRAFGAQ